MSGTSRDESAGTPVPTCHEGFAKNALAPPPPAASPLAALDSFQTVSGMYERAEPEVVPLLALQYCVAPVVLPSLNIVPPAPVTKGELAGKSTASPWVAVAASPSQSVAPESPAGPTTVMP